MTREEEKKQSALEYRRHTQEYGDTLATMTDRQIAFEAGWDAADLHPKNPWRDAKTDNPKRSGYVLADDGKASKVCDYNGILFIQENGCEFRPLYWMPIPELPKEEGGRR